MVALAHAARPRLAAHDLPLQLVEQRVDGRKVRARRRRSDHTAVREQRDLRDVRGIDGVRGVGDELDGGLRIGMRHAIQAALPIDLGPCL